MNGGGPAAPELRLHIPDEPTAHRARWVAVVNDGAPLEEVLSGEGGVADWLWARWRTLEGIGVDRDRFGALVLGYRRELWLWIAGQRTWAQCCSGLIGRIARRVHA